MPGPIDESLNDGAQKSHLCDPPPRRPTKILAEGTEWRFLNELKRELKA
jgi:hypothetical protein